MARPPQLYLVAYDVRHPKRLRRVHRLMRSYGDALQLSVFRCTLSDLHLAHLRALLEQVVKTSEDQVVIVHLGAADARTSWRTEVIGVPFTAPDPILRIV